MLAKIGKCIVILGVLVFAMPANAQVVDPAICGTSLPPCTATRTSCCVRNFTSTTTQKAILIPLDRCHQPFVNSVSQGGPDRTDNPPQWCHDDPSPQTNSQTYVYGLIYRLMQNKVPVHWIVNPTKAPSTFGVTATSTAASTKDVDMWILASAASPPGPAVALSGSGGHVSRLSASNIGTSSLTYSVADTYGRDQFPIRGSAFLIAPEDRAAFDAFMKTSLGRSTCGSGSDCNNFLANNGVILYQIEPGAKLVWQDYTQPLVSSKYVEFTNEAPIALRVDYAPPKVAVVAATTQMSSILQQANLDDLENTASCKAGTFTVDRAVGCVLTESDVTSSNRLVTTSFDNVWVDLSGPSSCSSFATKLQEFSTAVPFGCTAPCTPRTGGNIIMFGDSVDIAEQCAASRGALLGRPGTGLTLHGSAINDSDSEPFIIRYASNLLSQYGDLPLNFASGTVKGYDRVSGTTDLYNPLYYSSTTGNTLKRLVTQELVGTDCSNHKDIGVVGASSTGTCDDTANNTTSADYRDVFSYGRYLNDKRNGVVFYSPGQNPSTNPTKGHMKLILGTLLAVPPFLQEQVFTSKEVSRANPIAAAIGGVNSIVQGTFEYRYKTDTTGKCSTTTTTVCDTAADCPAGESCNLDVFTVPRAPTAVLVADDIGNFSFPYLVGHLRANAVASATISAVGTSQMDASNGEEPTQPTGTFPQVTYTDCTNAVTVTSGTAVANAPGFNGTTRAVWTTTTGAVSTLTQEAAHKRVCQTDTTISTKMLPGTAFDGSPPLSATTYRENFVKKILKGYDNGVGYVAQLGGIDRSTVAVIGPGGSIGTNRPTVAYVGATDGMLHAICAEAKGACERVGMELWAFIPRTNLPNLRYNLGRIDSSVHVMDARLTVGSKTVLLMQAGMDPDSDGATPAIYALDVSNPATPSVLWEYATFDSTSPGGNKSPTTRPVNGLGLGLSLAAGQVTISGTVKNLVFAHTNNGGSGQNGSYLIAIDINTGEKVWDRFYAYPSSTQTSTGRFARTAIPTVDISAGAIPHGVVTVDSTTTGANATTDMLVLADLYGNLWVLDPTNGQSIVKTSSSVEIPLFQFLDDFHPMTKPAIYNTGSDLFAAFTSGGYHDNTTVPLWGSYSPVAKPQMLASVRLPDTGTTSASPLVQAAPLNETSGSPEVPFVTNLTGFGFSQARVIGEEVFVTTDTTNINSLQSFAAAASSTGRITGFNINTNAVVTAITQTIPSGAGQVTNSGEDVFLPNRQKLIDTSDGAEYDAAYTAGLATTPPPQTTALLRRLWLRTE